MRAEYARRAQIWEPIIAARARREPLDIADPEAITLPQSQAPKNLEHKPEKVDSLANDNAAPRTFISYSWDSTEHREWVRAFASDLRKNGVDVILDQWHLHHGDDKTLFMETSVTESEFVLVVCTPQYAEKANKRVGGAGYEAMIITGQLADRTDLKKFIPVLRSGEWGSSAVPAWLKTKVGADMRGNPYPESQFRGLLRTLHRSHDTAPPLGGKPLFDEVRSQPQRGLPTPSHSYLSADLDLGLKERELLANAAQDPNGRILYTSTFDGEGLSTNGQQFIEQGNPRSAAEWLGALGTLESIGLVQALSFERQVFAITGNGYKLADRLGEFHRWCAGEITLEAHYFGRPADMVRIPCKRIIDIPPEYYPDDVGADGSRMRSLKEPRSLLVEGVEIKTLSGVKWKPTDVWFVDEKTGETIRFRVDLADTTEPRALRLAVTG